MSTSHPGYNKRQKELIIVASVSIVVQTVVVVLRIISRRLFRVKLWWDDYLCVLALVSIISPGESQVTDSGASLYPIFHMPLFC